MESPSKLYIEQASRILKANNKEAVAKVRSLSTNGHQIFILQFEEISSTMLLSENWNTNFLKQKTTFIFIARKQTSGRGQKTNTWHSPAGNIYFTMLTKQPLKVLSFLIPIASLSVVETVESCLELEAPLQIKWVNDIMIKNLKISGMLLKSDIIDDHLVLQIGIGINTNEKFVEGTACLKDFTEKKEPISIEQMDIIIDKLGINLLQNFTHAQEDGPKIREQQQKRLAWLDQEVTIYDAQFKNVITKGKFLGTNEHGFAIVQQPDESKGLFSDGRMRKQ